MSLTASVPRWKRWLPLLPVAIVVLGSVGWWAFGHLDWRRGARFDDASRQLRAARFERVPPLDVAMTDGVAADHYAAATAICAEIDFSEFGAGLVPAERALRPQPDDGPPLIEPGTRQMPDACVALGIAPRTQDRALVQLDEAVCARLAACRDALPHLRDGARARDATGPNYLWAEDGVIAPPYDLQARALAGLWLLDARIRGDHGAYLDTIADALRFAGDISRGGPYSIAPAWVRRVASLHLWSLLGGMSDAELDRFVAELSAAEAQAQTIEDATRLTWLWGAGGVIGGDRLFPTRANRDNPLPQRGGWHRRLVDRVAFDDELRRWEAAMEAQSGSWASRNEVYERLLAQENTVLIQSPVSVISSIQSWDDEMTTERAELRALRTAIRWQRWSRHRVGAFQVTERCPFTGDPFELRDGAVHSPPTSPYRVSVELP